MSRDHLLASERDPKEEMVFPLLLSLWSRPTTAILQIFATAAKDQKPERWK